MSSNKSEEWLEIPVFIHGIIPTLKPEKHDEEYDFLLKLINKSLIRKGKLPFTESPITIEWGWESGESQENDRFLAQAEINVASGVAQEVKRTWDWTFNPLRMLHNRLRKNFLLGFADMFYYASADGKKAVRNNVFNHLSKEIANRKKANEKISLTFITHSAGTVIAHDFLFHLFRKKQPSEFKKVNDIRKLVQQNNLRIRKFYTMGSPITPLIIRSDSLLLKIVKKKKIDIESMGLTLPYKDIKNPRWINFWDRDDIISYPLAFLYDHHGEIVDKYLDLGDIFPKVHNLYWSSKKVADEIARTF